MPYLSPRKSHARQARILPLRGRLGFSRSRETTTPQTCLRMRNTVDIRFAASEPATNKALQEVGFLGGFGLFGGCLRLYGPVISVLSTVSTFRDAGRYPGFDWRLSKRFGQSRGGPGQTRGAHAPTCPQNQPTQSLL
jgi:hypothetical protein